MVDTDRSTVEDLYGDSAIPGGEQDNLVGIANRLADEVFGGQLRTLGEVEGNDKDFKTFLAAHLWALREGETQSESQAGGTITYNVTTGDVRDSLTETRFGRMAKAYIRDGSSIGVEIA